MSPYQLGVAFGAAVAAVLLNVGCGGHAEDLPVDSLVVPERAGMLLTATEHYGPLIIQEGEFFAESATRPWSSYWYPIGDNILVEPTEFNGQQPTLEKYDHYSQKVYHRESTAVKYEIEKGLYNPDAQGWEGRCNAWAIASIVEPEPVLPNEGVALEGITFFTRDLKALLIKSYEEVDSESFMRFGQRYNGSRTDEWDDIYPDQFHRVLVGELFEKRRPFLMDSDADVQVWNTPVWKGQTRIVKDVADPHVMHVVTAVAGAKSTLVEPDYAGPSKNVTYEYSYDLIGSPLSDGSLWVKYGKWTGASIENHPDFMTTFPDSNIPTRHESSNKQLDLSVIEDILLKTQAHM